MAQQHHHQGGPVYKDEPGTSIGPGDHHHPHHSQQGPPPPQHLQHPRPSSIVHHQQGPPPQHQNAYPPQHGLPPQQQYGQNVQGAGGHHPQDLNPYYGQPSPYSTPSATGTYNSSAAPETPEIMAAAQMSRPAYPSIYQTPQSNSPASVASPSAHDQHQRSMYGQPAAHLQQQQPMYYPPQQQQYPPMPAQGGPSPYTPHPQHQPMTSQPNSLLMSHQGQHPMQHPGHQQQQTNMTNSPRAKLEHIPQIQRPPSGPLGAPPQHQQNGPPMGNANNVPGTGVNPNAAPGPIPATTPLVVRQDGNGVQWIAFEYSRDRVKMEYTIRCDVESVNAETLSPEFKTENCVYPRACCSKDQYRGNRLVYESECNTVGWALAELNPCLRGKRGLIQRAVDSWRNSNQDPRLRSRRVRRMAKINNRKAVQAHTSNPHMPGPGASAGMPPSGSMGPGNAAANMGKPGLGNMGGSQIHHHHANPGGSGNGGPDDGSGDGSYIDDESQHHHHHSAAGQGPPQGGDSAVRQSQVFANYPGQYPPPNNVGGPSMAPQMHDGMPSLGQHSSNNAIAAKADQDSDNESLFGNLPDDKKRKFILVEDDVVRGSRVRVRVTLDTVNPQDIPDSYRKSTAVFPRSFFPIEMQSPPPSARGSRFFEDDDDDVSGDGPSARGKTFVPVPLPDGSEASLPAPRVRKSQRNKEVKINDLAYRMAWHQSRVFKGRTVFLQKALDCYRNKMRSTMDGLGTPVRETVPHFETRVGKRRLNERVARRERKEEA